MRASSHFSVLLAILPIFGSSRCDLTWQALEPCAEGSYRPGPGALCVPVTTCTADQYELKAPTPTSDRRCETLTPCTADQYELESPTPTRNRQCETLTACTAEQYESAPPTETSDRQCSTRTVCEPGEQQVSPGTATADATCEACAVGTYCAGGSEPSVSCDWRDTDCDPTTPCAKVIQVSAGYAYTCALDDSGAVTCWGSDGGGRRVVPDDLGRIVQVSVGTYETCALDRAGEAACWGSIPTPFSRRQRPEDPSTIVQVSGGDMHMCTLDDADRIVCWGFCSPGECDAPEGLGPVVQITTGSSFTCGLDEAGVVTCWGEYSDGRIDVPPDLARVVQIDAGDMHGCALDEAGAVTCWGDDSYGQSSVPADLGRVLRVSAGGAHSCAVGESGKVTCWGDDSYGQSSVPPDLGTIVQVSAGSAHTCAVDDAGAVTCWGTGGDQSPCPVACEPSDAQECSPPLCGNGVVDPGETCDPITTCPTACDDGDACTLDQVAGSAASCDVICSHTPMASCTPAKRLAFYIEDVLVRPDIGEVLRGYVDDVNTMFAKTTARRFQFDPVQDVRVWTEGAEPPSTGRCLPIDNDYSYAAVIKKNRSTFPLSHGGSGACANLDNQLTMGGFEWNAFFSRAEVPANADEYYRRQLTALLHELGHLHGLAGGEYYTLASMSDDTGLPPDLDVANYVDQDPYWGTRLGVLDDPMLGAGSDAQSYMSQVRFGSLSSYLINATVSYVIPPPDPANEFVWFFGNYEVPDDQVVSVRVTDRDTGELLAGCPLSVFNIDVPNTTGNLLITSGTTDAQGTFTFVWGNGNLHSSFNLARLIKAACPGYAPTGEWVSVFDMQAWLFMPNGGDDGDFHYHGAVELRPTSLPGD